MNLTLENEEKYVEPRTKEHLLLLLLEASANAAGLRSIFLSNDDRMYHIQEEPVLYNTDGLI